MRKNVLVKLNILSLALVFLMGMAFFIDQNTTGLVAQDFVLDDQEATIRAIAETEDAVVNVIVYDEETTVLIDFVTGEQESSTKKVQKGRGTGFLISQDGYILTNKHVVESAGDVNASYRIIMNTGKQYYAQLIGKDPLNDLAVLKIFDENLPFVRLGDSNSLQVGTSVIAIGNALGQYQNSATKGIVSGLGRSILAAEDSGSIEVLDNVIQTDAEINFGNSGGPLINLRGEVIGINVAIDESGRAIGFAIPVNDARPVINSIIESGRIIRPRLGISYTMLTPEIAIDNKLNRTSGAWINSVSGKPVVEGGPAERAGLRDGDVIFEINAIAIEGKNTLLSVVQKYKPGEKIGMKVLRGEKVLILVAELDEF